MSSSDPYETNQTDSSVKDSRLENSQGIEEQIKSQVKDSGTWLRLFFMFLFMFIFYLIFVITGLVGIIQFVARIVSGKTLDSLGDFNRKLSSYAQEVVAYITYSSDKKPFPFSE
jgi:hypothetical protein